MANGKFLIFADSDDAFKKIVFQILLKNGKNSKVRKKNICYNIKSFVTIG